MFVTPAYAQAAGPAGGGDIIMSLLPFVLIFVIMYFLLIRPQRQQMKKRQEMLAAIRRNDTVVTGGGVVGKVTKVVDDTEVEVEIAQGTKVRVVRAMIAEVRVKGEPAAANDAGDVKAKSKE
jgi:preprotein translocase subunit YajC